MSDSIALARAALARMNMREQAINPHYSGFATDMMMMARTDPEQAQVEFMERTRTELCEAYGFGKVEQRKPFAFANGVAVIPIHGTLLNRFGSSWGYVTGYNFIRSQHNAALLDDDVTHIIHDHNSYGGEAAGCFELSAEIAASRGKKPIIAMVDSNCYSASFALASAADKIVAIPSAGVGSIGVVATHIDMSKMLEDIGIKVTFIHSGDHKVDGNPYEPLPKEVKANIQKGVDKSRDNFVSLVAQNLGMDKKIVHNTEAQTYRAEDALEIGLIHKIAAPASALESILNDEVPEESSNTNPTTESDMSTPEAQAAAAAAAQAAAAPAAAAAAPAVAATAAAPAAAAPAADAGAIERARISGILGSDEAKANPGLANHYAFKTGASVDEAKAAMQASAPAAAPAAAAAAAAAAKPNQFEQAMANAVHPNVGADGDAGAAAASGSSAEALNSALAAYEKASGIKLAEK